MCQIRENAPPTQHNVNKKANDVLDISKRMILSSIEHLLSWRYEIKIIG